MDKIQSAVWGKSPMMAAGTWRVSTTLKASWLMAKPTNKMIGAMPQGGMKALQAAKRPQEFVELPPPQNWKSYTCRKCKKILHFDTSNSHQRWKINSQLPIWNRPSCTVPHWWCGFREVWKDNDEHLGGMTHSHTEWMTTILIYDIAIKSQWFHQIETSREDSPTRPQFEVVSFVFQLWNSPSILAVLYQLSPCLACGS